ncbi:MAG: RING-H2 finger protein [Candidatus Thorarchaeota archaeon]
MGDNNQPNVPPSFPPTPVREMDEELTQFLSYIRRETQIRNHINSALSSPFNIRPINSLTPNIPSNQFYFHDLFRHARRPAGYNNATNVVLANSLREQGGVRNVISNDGKKQLTTECYEKGKFTNTVCPILQEEFSEGDKVTVLPCNHCFYPDGIMQWLESNKAECPVCRHKLLSKEVSNRDSERDSDEDSVPSLVDEDDEDEDEDQDQDQDQDEDDEDEGPDLFTLGGSPNLNIIGNTIPQSAVNPLLTRILENMVRQNVQNRLNTIDASANRVSPATQENSIFNTTEPIDTVDEDTMDLQMAIYASMAESNADSNEEVD